MSPGGALPASFASAYLLAVQADVDMSTIATNAA
jgi:hypothetical protein